MFSSKLFVRKSNSSIEFFSMSFGMPREGVEFVEDTGAAGGGGRGRSLIGSDGGGGGKDDGD